MLALAAVATTGCAGNYTSNNPYPPANVGSSFPSAATGAAPIADITQSNLPSPTDPYPTAPGLNGQAQAMANAGNGMVGVIGGINLAAASIAGVWNANIDGMSCKIATPMTKFGKGYRSAPMHCPTAISAANSWNISGSKLEFFDASGAVVATLSSQDGRYFNGQTVSGSNISLSR